MKILYAIILFGVLNLNNTNEEFFIYDYYDGIQASQIQQKPIFLLFTGINCKNNKYINELIKNDNGIMKKITIDYVPVILNVNDRTKLTKQKQIIRNGKTLVLRTKGNEWAQLEVSKFQRNIQPLIVIIDSNEQVIKQPIEGEIIREDLLEYLYD